MAELGLVEELRLWEEQHLLGEQHLLEVLVVLLFLLLEVVDGAALCVLFLVECGWGSSTNYLGFQMKL